MKILWSREWHFPGREDFFWEVQREVINTVKQTELPPLVGVLFYPRICADFWSAGQAISMHIDQLQHIHLSFFHTQT